MAFEMKRHSDAKEQQKLRTQWKAWHYQILVILYYVGSPTLWNHPKLCQSGLCLVRRQMILCDFQSMETRPQSESINNLFFKNTRNRYEEK